MEGRNEDKTRMRENNRDSEKEFKTKLWNRFTLEKNLKL